MENVYNEIAKIVDDLIAEERLMGEDAYTVINTAYLRLHKETDADFNRIVEVVAEVAEDYLIEENEVVFDLGERIDNLCEELDWWRDRFATLTDAEKTAFYESLKKEKSNISPSFYDMMVSISNADELKWSNDAVIDNIAKLHLITEYKIDIYNSHRKRVLRISFGSVEERHKNDIFFTELSHKLGEHGWVNGKKWTNRYMYEDNNYTPLSDRGREAVGSEVAESAERQQDSSVGEE